MRTLDIYIARRFLANFAILLGLLFVFAISIDFILQLDEFVEAASEMVGPGAGLLSRIAALGPMVVDFYGPRVFQFYAYMVGLLAVGSMGFTFAQMHRARELTAVLASGVRLHRVALPVLVAALSLNVVQMVNQELILPALASRLIRTHGSLGRSGVETFEVRFTADGAGNLFQAPSFDASTGTLVQPTILVRDESGRTVQRLMADRAPWDVGAGGWRLVNGRAMTPAPSVAAGAAAPAESANVAPEVFHSDLTPHVLILRRYRQFATMLSLSQIREMMQTPGVVDTDALVRFAWGRFATILINMLLLVISLPFFLLREPADLLRKSMLCCAVSIPVMMGALLGFAGELPGFPPAVGVFLPGIILVPVALFMLGLVKT